MKLLHLNPATWETESQQLSAWRCTVQTAANVIEEERVQKAKDKRLIRKQRLETHLQQHLEHHTSVLPVEGPSKPGSASSATADPISPSLQRDVLGHRRRRRSNNSRLVSSLTAAWQGMPGKCRQKLSFAFSSWHGCYACATVFGLSNYRQQH